MAAKPKKDVDNIKLFCKSNGDDDAELLWQQVAGVPKSRIFRLDEKDGMLRPSVIASVGGILI